MDINSAWKSTCRAILGTEVGELDNFQEYLLKYIDPIIEKKSSFSGKQIAFSAKYICDGARFMADCELPEFEKKIANQKLDINQIKDIDSILEAIGDIFYYSGNVILGNSRNVEYSDHCVDCNHVYKSKMILEKSSYIAFCEQSRANEYCFGTAITGECKFIIHSCQAWRDTRCMEIMRVCNCSDCLYVANLDGCNNCMFSFNLRNKSHSIGNLELSKEKYFSLKKKLISEIADTLKHRKTIPTIVDIIAEDTDRSAALKVSWTNSNAPKAVEAAFETTTGIVLGKKLGPIKAYEDYLNSNVDRIVGAKSRVSEKTVYIAPILAFTAIAGNVVKYDEALELGKKHLSEAEVEKLTLANAGKVLSNIKNTTPEVIFTTSIMDVEECACYGPASHAFHSSNVHGSKYVSHSFWPRNSEYIFGSSCILDYSKFCIKCYNSSKLSRCFEVEGCTNCSDCYFCHNCEGLSECMFCFNAKSKRYAIGNIEIGREKYMELKKKLLLEIVDKLEKDKFLKLNIYNIGCRNNELMKNEN